MSLNAARKTRLRNGAVFCGSLLLHAAILTALGWPVMTRFQDRSNDEDALSVTLERSVVPRRPAPETLASPDRAAAALPVQPRAPRLAPPSWVRPLGVGPVPGPPAPPNRVTGTPPKPQGPEGDLRTALRGSSAGCANADAVGLNRREQEHCDEKFGATARNAPVYDAPMEAGKRRGFDEQAIRQDAARAAREAPVGVGVDHRSREGPGTMKEIPWVGGAEQDGLGNPRSAAQQRLKQLQDADKADERRKKAERENDQR
ncbi:hypothetical protein ASD21_06735 [Caulobacter sp. Root1455]|uniref:hypothetical protein n=1 Tax=unclassified Caulobacter TaxID=2648921 RepID=UPI0006F9CB1E|nr:MULTISPECIES: hypothetical protein [unclassified Caulobacter]KQY29224.1 hypothetical protein ASD38_07635 [Caulobacter sp. Root487D2Y]KQY96188.1 hypothetical protein ASD21_06735 [Caulobacter sp. Root1455]